MSKFTYSNYLNDVVFTFDLLLCQFLKIFFSLFVFMPLSVLAACVSIQYVHVQYPHKPTEGVELSGTGGVWQPTCGCWELKRGPLKEKLVLLITESSPLNLFWHFRDFFSQYVHICNSFGIKICIFKTDLMQHLRSRKTGTIKIDIWRPYKQSYLYNYQNPMVLKSR